MTCAACQEYKRRYRENHRLEHAAYMRKYRERKSRENWGWKAAIVPLTEEQETALQEVLHQWHVAESTSRCAGNRDRDIYRSNRR